jgi:SAM-dependent methyltransferase
MRPGTALVTLPAMAVHPLAAQFASVAGAYERGRPEYPIGAIGAIAAELGLRPGAPVLDLAAGTGKLSRALLAAGLEVIGVEPLASLRAVLVEKIGAERVRDGVAEEIPLDDESVDAVTVADAFHWFDHARAVPEIRRVLRPGGGLAVISMVPDWSGASWAHELGTLIVSSRPEHPNFDGPAWRDALAQAGGWAAPRELKVTISQPARTERIVDYLGSISWIAGMPTAAREAMLDRIRVLIETGETPAEMPIHVVIGLAARS